MPGVGRQSQDNIGGGIITGPSAPSVIVNGTPISVVGDTCVTHGDPPHVQGSSRVAVGSDSVIAEGIPITVANQSTTTCGHPVTPGSPDVEAT